MLLLTLKAFQIRVFAMKCAFLIVERVSGMKSIAKNVTNFITEENHSDLWLLLVDKAVRFFREKGASHRNHFMVHR